MKYSAVCKPNITADKEEEVRMTQELDFAKDL